MESYLGGGEDLTSDTDHLANDFSINNEEVSSNVDSLAGSFDGYKKTISFGKVYDSIKEFEEINKRIDR